MTVEFLIFMWLLPLTASGAVTSDQNNDFTGVMTTTQVTPDKFTHDQLRTGEASSFHPAADITQAVGVDANPTEAELSAEPSVLATPTAETSSPSSPQRAASPPAETSSPSSTQAAASPPAETSSPSSRQTAASPPAETSSPSSRQTAASPTAETSSPSSPQTAASPTAETSSPSSRQTAASPTAETSSPSSPTTSTSAQLNSSTVGMKSTTQIQVKAATSAAAAVVTGHAVIPTTAPLVPSTPRSSTQSQLTNATTTRPFTRPTASTKLISATTTSTEHKSTSTSSVTGDDAASTGSYGTSEATTRTPSVLITKLQERQVPPEKSNQGSHHSKAVAGVIGGALLAMMVGFLLIYIKKRKLQRQQITTTDWAGPSPFLEGGADNGHVTLRSSNRISLSSFLPQRLSKRLSLLPERGEELADMTQATTFGDNHQGITFGREVDGDDVEESNGNAVVVPETTGDAAETVQNSQTNDPLQTTNTSEAADSANPPTLPGADGSGQP